MIRLQLQGDREMEAALTRADAGLKKPVGPLLQLLGEAWAAQFQRHILDEGPPGTVWPALAPYTQKQRARLGFGAQHPILRRRSDLLHSLAVLQFGPNFVDVGTVHKGAKALHEGAPAQGLPPRPFVVLTEELQAETMDAFEDYFLEGLA